MKKSNLFTKAFLSSLLTVLIGTILKILHFPGGQFFLILTFVLTIIYIITALSEIYGSERISTNEKIMWTVSFILFCTIAGLLYFFVGRPRIKREYKILNQTRHN
jgi:multisubunit Na+/H+ antiporter MnhB subunit